MGERREGTNTSDLKDMTFFFLADTSGSMCGAKIDVVNKAGSESVKLLTELELDSNIRCAVLTIGLEVTWMYPESVCACDFKWDDLLANGPTPFGLAFKKLNIQLTRKSKFLGNSTAGCYMPVFFLLSDGVPNDEYKMCLNELWQNPWFKRGIKVALAVGDDADAEILSEFTGTSDLVFAVSEDNMDNIAELIKTIFVSSSRISVSHDYRSLEERQVALHREIKSVVQADDELWQ